MAIGDTQNAVLSAMQSKTDIMAQRGFTQAAAGQAKKASGTVTKPSNVATSNPVAATKAALDNANKSKVHSFSVEKNGDVRITDRQTGKLVTKMDATTFNKTYTPKNTGTVVSTSV